MPRLGGTPTRNHDGYWGNTVPWISARDVTSAPSALIIQTQEHTTDKATERTRAKPLPPGSVIVTARGTVGAVARLGVAAAFNQSCYGFEPGDLPPGVLYLTILAAMKGAHALAHGSVFDTITIKLFDFLEAPKFSTEQVARIESQVAPLLDLIENCERQDTTLAELRDTLLPPLMSGRLRVKDAGKTVGDVV